jgi:hypothetical protein
MPTNHDRVGVVNDRLAGHHRKMMIVRLQILDLGRRRAKHADFDNGIGNFARSFRQ